jgi:hypothetical protein
VPSGANAASCLWTKLSWALSSPSQSACPLDRGKVGQQVWVAVNKSHQLIHVALIDHYTGLDILWAPTGNIQNTGSIITNYSILLKPPQYSKDSRSTVHAQCHWSQEQLYQAKHSHSEFSSGNLILHRRRLIGKRLEPAAHSWSLMLYINNKSNGDGRGGQGPVLPLTQC